MELRGFEPLTSCMPWGMLTFTDATCQSRTAWGSMPHGYAWNDGQTHDQDDVCNMADLVTEGGEQGRRRSARSMPAEYE